MAPTTIYFGNFFSRCQLALDATFCFSDIFVGTATWSQVGGYHANGGYKGLTRPPGRAVPVANHHQPNNCPACLAAQEVPLAYLQHLWVPRVPMGTFGTSGYPRPSAPWSSGHHSYSLTRITMVTMAVVILVFAFLLLTITTERTTLFLQRRLTSTSQLSPLSFLTCLTFPHHGPLLVTT